MRIKGKGKSILKRQRLPVLGLFEGLLDQVSGAAAAYSIRLLRADYSDGLLRVRAYDGSSDQGEADVRPYKIGDEKYIDLNSPIENLDSNATNRGLSNSDTLGDLVDSGGANYDGFVPKWYDQSPNGDDIGNTTATEQPRLIQNGTIHTRNGKPTLKHLNSRYLFKNGMSNGLSEFYEVLYQNESIENIPRQIDLSDRYNANTYSLGVAEKGGTSGIDNNVGAPIYRKNGSDLSSPNRDDLYTSFEGNQNLLNVRTISNLSPGFDLGLHAYTGTQWLLQGDVQEWIGFSSNRSSSQRSTIETLINDFFQIPNF